MIYCNWDKNLGLSIQAAMAKRETQIAHFCKLIKEYISKRKYFLALDSDLVNSVRRNWIIPQMVFFTVFYLRMIEEFPGYIRSMTHLTEPSRLSLKVAHKSISKNSIIVLFGISNKLWREVAQGSYPSFENCKRTERQWALKPDLDSAITNCVHSGLTICTL